MSRTYRRHDGDPMKRTYVRPYDRAAARREAEQEREAAMGELSQSSYPGMPGNDDPDERHNYDA